MNVAKIDLETVKKKGMPCIKEKFTLFVKSERIERRSYFGNKFRESYILVV